MDDLETTINITIFLFILITLGIPLMLFLVQGVLWLFSKATKIETDKARRFIDRIIDTWCGTVVNVPRSRFAINDEIQNENEDYYNIKRIHNLYRHIERKCMWMFVTKQKYKKIHDMLTGMIFLNIMHYSLAQPYRFVVVPYISTTTEAWVYFGILTTLYILLVPVATIIAQIYMNKVNTEEEVLFKVSGKRLW